MNLLFYLTLFDKSNLPPSKQWFCENLSH